jgi:polysaccharide export outer membrane protein
LGAATPTGGDVDYEEGMRVTDALAKAGGTGSVRPDWITLKINFAGGGSKDLPLPEIMANAESPNNVVLHPGDTLILQEIPKQTIFIAGAVMKPGAFDLREINPKPGRIGVMEALAEAGGATEKAVLSEAVIIRADRSAADAGTPSVNPPNRKEERVNLARLRQAPSAGSESTDSPEAYLYPGDTLQIPETTEKIVVMGSVKNPGAFSISGDQPMTLSVALGLAGGLDKKAKKGEINVIRQARANTGAKPSAVVLKANWNALVTKRDLSQDIALQPGDVVYVPESSRVNILSELIPGLSSAASLLYFTGLTRAR